MSKQIQLYEASRMTLDEAIAESIASLQEYATRYSHWVATFSGGKDSTALVIFLAWVIKTGLVQAPKSFTALYSDTGMELHPLWLGAMQTLKALEADGFNTQVVRADLDNRFWVCILGRGLPPPNNGRRWCTRVLKGTPMMSAINSLPHKDDTLTLTGVRLGESRSRDERISASCDKDSGECGQGWFQSQANLLDIPSLAPLVHWRVCNVFDWLYFEKAKHGYDASGVLAVYGEDDIRTGCYKCELVAKDKSLEKVSKMPDWKHLGELEELEQVYDWLNLHSNRLIMPPRKTKNGKKFIQKVGTIGPIKIEARQKGLEWVLDIQRGAGIVMISPEEEARIRQMWTENIWPKGWTGEEPQAGELNALYKVSRDGLSITIQDQLFGK
jgi:DNA sulfur modification protein DndC